MEHHEHAPTPTPEVSTTKSDNLSIPLAIVFAGILVAGAILFTDRTGVAPTVEDTPTRNQAGADTDQVAPEILALREDDHILGNPNAEVLVIEYSDPECPFCKNYHDTMKQVMDVYGKSGSVAWVYRHFPLDQIHPKARKESEGLECANELGGNAAFWKYTDKIFEVTPSNNRLDLGELPKIAASIGLNVEQFNACLSSGKYAERVQKDFESGVAAGVRGTPHSIAWNKKTGKQMVVNGAQPFEAVKTILGLVVDAK